MRRIHRLAALSLVLAGVTFAGAAAADPASDLAAAENAYTGLDYTAALSGAEAVLAQKNLSHDILTRATRVSALSHAALGQGEQAKQQFILMLEYDSDFRIDSKLGPRYSEPFSEARGFWQAQSRRPGMDVQVQVQYGQGGELRVVSRDPLGIVKKISVGQRWAPGRQYAVADLDGSSKNFEVPANPEGSTRLEYYVRALDARGDAVFENGTPEVPSTTVVNEAPHAAAAGAEKKSIFKSPVLYVVGGALLAGAAVGLYFAFRPTEYTTPTSGRAIVGAGCGAARCE